jgi:hypothetical protein
MEIVKLELTGLSPLLMHSERGANPLDPETKLMKKITSKKNKTDEDYEEMAFMDWKMALYHNDSLGPYIPGLNIRASVVEGGKMNKLGTLIQKGTMVLDSFLPLIYNGPKTIKELWANPKFRDIRSVVVNRSRMMRCRPIFHEWKILVDLHYDTKVIDIEKILMGAENAGSYIGIGDFRPGKGNGSFGRYEVKMV